MKMSLNRRRITLPPRFGHFENFPTSESEEEKIEEDDEYTPKKVKRRKRKIEIFRKSNWVLDAEIPVDSSATVKCDPSISLPETEPQNADNMNGDKKKHGANAYVCDRCGKVLRSNDTLSRHMISHSGAKPFLCNVCNKGFSSAVTLKEHKARHDNKMLYECNICSKSFRQNSCYCRHLQTHSKVSPHVCPTCGQRFTLKDYLRSHMKKHSTEKKYGCSECKKAFTHQSDLNRHKITHTSERPYKCEICGLAFTDNSSRRRHEKDHSNHAKSEVHPCNKCSSKFSSAVLLQQHKKKQHSPLPILSTAAETKERTSDDFVLVDIEIAKETDSPHYDLKDTLGVDLHSEEQVPASEFSARTATMSKPASCEIADYQNYLESDEYSGNYIELEHTLQAAPVSAFREELPPSPIEDVNSHGTHSKNDRYRYFTITTAPIEKSLPSYSSELQSVLPAQFQIDYVTYPDFNNQNYYTWLSDFVSLCKLVSFPIEAELFNKISQVHKSIVDVLAYPLGILCCKNNFKILRSISQDLLQVIEGHLNFIYEHLQE